MHPFWILIICALVFLSGSCECKLNNFAVSKPKKNSRSRSITKKRNSPKTSENDPFMDIATYFRKVLKKSFNNKDGLPIQNTEYALKDILSTVRHIASSQAALKSMDGITHSFKNVALKQSPSLRLRVFKFVRQNRSKKEAKLLRSARVRKEAAKLWEYVQVVERGMQAAEILQSVSTAGKKPARSPSGDEDRTRKKYLAAAGLEEIRRVKISSNHGIHLVVSALRPIIESNGSDTRATNHTQGHSLGRFSHGELVLAVTLEDEEDMHKQFRCVLSLLGSEPPLLGVPLKGVGFAREEVSLQPTLFHLAQQALDAVADLLAPPPSTQREAVMNIDSTKNSNCTVNVEIAVSGNASSVVNDTISAMRNDSSVNASVSCSVSVSYPSVVRLVGHSSGGSVAAYMTMILDGAMNISISNSSVAALFTCVNKKVQKQFVESVANASRYSGLYNGRVSCLCLGPQPCMSRSLIPRCVMSIVCGDDAVARASPESHSELTEKLQRLLASRTGTGFGGLGKLVSSGSSWLGEISDLAGKSLSRYSAGQHDISSLSLPGRVFFLKARRLKEGVTLQRILRGNWQEDVLWQIHSILLSEKMVTHHSLQNYVRTLNRC